MKELDLQRGYLQGAEIETIYFGGGTPSLLNADEINRLAEHIWKLYRADRVKEFTLETNPDDLTLPYLQSLKSTPVNRFSIGIQSFKESDLLYMNRAHNAQQADYAIKAAQDTGFEKLSIDLIYGTPDLTDSEWLHNLSMVKKLRIPHFSAYALTVEKGTALQHAIAKKKTAAIDNEQAAAQFEILMEQAAALGYEHYEISNLALPDHYAVHNTNYWRGVPYLGIGPSAHSFDGKTRRWNVANNALYAKNILQHQQPLYEEEKLTPTDVLNEYIMTSLRTMWGCNLKKIRREHGPELSKQVFEKAMPYMSKGWVTAKQGKLYLTNSGKLFADHIAGNLFA